MGERGEEGAARPGEIGNGERGLKNPDFRTSGEGKGCFALYSYLKLSNIYSSSTHIPANRPDFIGTVSIFDFQNF